MKKLILIGIIFILVNIELSGCTSENEKKIYEEEILGKWFRTEPKTENINVIFTFFSNGTYAITIWDVNKPNNINTEYASYNITDKTLVLEIRSTGKIFTYEYSFSNNYNKLTIVSIDDSSKSSIFLKQN